MNNEVHLSTGNADERCCIDQYVDGTPLRQWDIVNVLGQWDGDRCNGVIVKIWKNPSEESRRYGLPNGGFMVAFDDCRTSLLEKADEKLVFVKRGVGISWTPRYGLSYNEETACGSSGKESDWNPYDYYKVDFYLDGTPISQGDVVVDPYNNAGQLHGVVVRAWSVPCKDSCDWSCPAGGFLVSWDDGSIISYSYADEHVQFLSRMEKSFRDSNTGLWVNPRC